MAKDKTVFYKLYDKVNKRYVTRGHSNDIWKFPNGPSEYLLYHLKDTLHVIATTQELEKRAENYEVHTFKIQLTESVNIGESFRNARFAEECKKKAAAQINVLKANCVSLMRHEMGVTLPYETIKAMYKSGKLSAGLLEALRFNITEIQLLKTEHNIK